MATGFAWVLNLDADLELGAGARYEPSKSVRRAMDAPVRRLAGSLLGPRDVLVDEASPVGVAGGLPGRAFCPTPRALAILRRAGAEPEPHPAVDILRRVNSRAFASALGATMPDAAFVTELDAARALLATSPGTGNGWRVKHAFGVAGRNQRVVLSAAMDDRSLAFLRRGLAAGGVQIEPNVAIEAEYAVHGLVARDRALRLGAVVRQRCDARGAWRASEPIAGGRGVAGDVVDRLVEESRRVAGALAAAGYFGPFGVDAFTYRDRGGALCLQPRSEINARYSMGFAVGFGPLGDEP
jgi:hypothetical protein